VECVHLFFFRQIFQKKKTASARRELRTAEMYQSAGLPLSEGLYLSEGVAGPEIISTTGNIRATRPLLSPRKEQGEIIARRGRSSARAKSGAKESRDADPPAPTAGRNNRAPWRLFSPRGQQV